MNKIEIVNYAYEKCEFYRSRKNKNKSLNDFYTIPILTKQEILNSRFMLLNDDYKYNNLNLLVNKHTSGTSGIPLMMFWDKNDYIQSNYYLWKFRYKFYGILPSTKAIRFISSVYYNDKVYFVKGNIFYIIKEKVNDISIGYLIKKIEEFNAEAIFSQPSFVLYFINLILNNNLNFPMTIKYIETTGEFLDDNLRDLIKNKFKQIKLVNMYGSEENNGIAIECPCGTMHVLEDNVYIETIDNNSEGVGKAIVTNLQNKVMPLIRYDIGDLVKLNKKRCSCGIEGKIIEKLEGRIDDIFIEKNVKLSNYFLSSIIFYINNELDFPIKEYKFIYDAKVNTLYIQISIDKLFDKWINTINEKITYIIRKEFGTNILSKY